jgi:proteasome assembly chaperone (PAC2) family protein
MSGTGLRIRDVSMQLISELAAAVVGAAGSTMSMRRCRGRTNVCVAAATDGVTAVWRGATAMQESCSRVIELVTGQGKRVTSRRLLCSNKGR